MKAVKWDLEELLLLVGENNQRAFSAFYNLYYDKVFRFVYYYLRQGDATAEVVSEVFFIVWKSRRTLKEIKSLDAYLYIIAKNEAIRYLRHNTDYRKVGIEDIPLHLELSEDTELEDRLEKEEIERLIEKIINKLPEKCRVIFLMNRAEGMQTKEIARALSLSESTVRVQMKIAVDRILEELKNHYPNLNLITILGILFIRNFS